MAENNKTEKTRWYTVQRNFHFETHDADGNVTRDISPEDWREEVEQYMNDLYKGGDVKQYVMIFHDKDTAGGVLKELHTHMIVELKNPATKSTAGKKLKTSSDRNIEAANDKGARAGAARYLLHITEKAIQDGKHIYGEDELITEGGLDVHAMMKTTTKALSGVTYKETDRAALEVSLAIEREGMTLDEANAALFEKIGDELAAQNTSLNWESRLKISDERYKKKVAEKMNKDGRNLVNMFVTGKGGSGKSTFARMLAVAIKDEAPYKVAVGGKGKTFDFADGYDREKVTIVDDARSSQFNMEEYLSIFDPYVYSPVSSRNNNKAWLSEYALMTTSETIDKFNEELMIYSEGGSQFKNALPDPFKVYNDKPAEDAGKPVGMKGHPRLNDSKETLDRFYQVARRMKYVFKIEDKHITMKKFNHDAVTYDDMHTYPWDVAGSRAALNDTIAAILEVIEYDKANDEKRDERIPGEKKGKK